MSSIPPLNSYSGVPEYTVNYTSEHPPLAFPSLNNSVAINLCLDDTPDFLNSPKLNKAKLPNETAIPIPTEGEFFFVPQGFVPILIVESITSVIEYNFPPEVIPLTQPNFSTPIYPIPSAATFAPIPSIKKIHPATSTLANTKEKHLKVKKAPRPTNAFILFRRENHGRIFQQSPHLSNNDVSKTLARASK
ncbi:hypothetical protein K7432_007445 [Basidiobolus ranarum]|uniref:HMG box domain-containing protein n=1 Tax=Basidiobolus ranarum TaxID=34480 RepID=A0ABR2WTF9_9FUNG